MHVHGYRAIGVDFAEKTIWRLQETFPKIDARVADIRDLPFPDNYFIGYWSLSVIEHFWDGYHDVLKEMRRVLISGGYVFLSFPYMSPLRKLKAKLGLYREFNGEGEDNFYQFVLDSEAVIRDFEASGFSLLGKRCLDGIKGFKSEVSVSRLLLQKLYDYQGHNLWIRGIRYILDRMLVTFAGHSLFLVLRSRKDI